MIKKNQLFLIFVVAVCLTGCSSVKHVSVPASDNTQIVHLLNRIGFGPSPDDVAKVRSMGIDAYIEEQLNPSSIAESDVLETRLASLKTLTMSINQISTDFEPPADVFSHMSDEERKQVNKAKNQVVSELAQAKVLSALLSPAQLQEVMVDFWFNHFNLKFPRNFEPTYRQLIM